MAESRINTTTHSATPNPDRRSLWKSRRALLALWGLECDESSPRSLSNSNGEFWTEEDYLQDRGLGCFQISDLSDRKSYKTWVNYMLLISSFFLRISEVAAYTGSMWQWGEASFIGATWLTGSPDLSNGVEWESRELEERGTGAESGAVNPSPTISTYLTLAGPSPAH